MEQDRVQCVRLFGQTFHALTLDEAVKRVGEFLDARSVRLVGAKNVAGVLACHRDAAIRDFYERCDLVTVDGRPLCYLSVILGRKLPEMVGGPRLWDMVAHLVAQRQVGLYLFGGRPGVAARARSSLRRRYPTIRIVGAGDGVLCSEQVAERALDDVMASEAEIVFIGLPHPVRERVATQLVEMGYGGVCVLVGGMLDVFAGERKLAPRIVSVLCLEWVYRIVQEPRRLTGRYVRDAIGFATLILSRGWERAVSRFGKVKRESES